MLRGRTLLSVVRNLGQLDRQRSYIEIALRAGKVCRCYKWCRTCKTASWRQRTTSGLPALGRFENSAELTAPAP